MILRPSAPGGVRLIPEVRRLVGAHAGFRKGNEWSWFWFRPRAAHAPAAAIKKFVYSFIGWPSARAPPG
jgi:hypothetical protein